MTVSIITTLASATPEASEGIFEALGIDWQMILFQIIGFSILVVLMGKFVYPILMRAVDARQDTIEEGAQAAAAAEAKAASAQKDIAAALKEARSEAADIVSTAKNEAIAMVDKAENNAKTRSERIVAEAHEEISKDVLKARKALESDTLKLVKQAAGLAIEGVADDKLDTAMVKKSLTAAGASKGARG